MKEAPLHMEAQYLPVWFEAQAILKCSCGNRPKKGLPLVLSDKQGVALGVQENSRRLEN